MAPDGKIVIFQNQEGAGGVNLLTENMAKQNTHTARAARHDRNGTNPDGSGKSAYSKKVREGKQMYGPGCCAHRIRLAGDHS